MSDKPSLSATGTATSSGHGHRASQGLAVARALLSCVVLLSSLGSCAADRAEDPASTEPADAGDPFRQLVESMTLETADVLALVIPSGTDGVPDQVVLATRAEASPSDVMAVLRDVTGYPETVDQVTRVDVTEQRVDGVSFEMELEVPLQNLVYELSYSYPSEDKIEVLGVSGVLEGGRFSWEVSPRGLGATVIYSTRASLGDDAGLLVNAVLRIHPDLQEGLMFAQGLRFLRAIRSAAEEVARARRVRS